MSETAPMNVIAIVVTYGPDDRLDCQLDTLACQVSTIWIVDNGSDEETIDRLQSHERALGPRLKLILNEANQGLAAAQNQGIAAALGDGADWLLLLDQDSIPAKDMISQLLCAAENYDCPERIGFLSPIHGDDTGGTGSPVYAHGYGMGIKRYWLAEGEVDDGLAFAMASGCLVPADRLREIGNMAADFWIDYIDYDFSFRIRRAGYRILGVGSARLRHRLGETHSRKVLGLSVGYRTHPAFRRYTIYRNRVRVMRAHGIQFPGFLAFEALSITKDLARLLLVEDDKLEKLRAIIIGVWDGLNGRGGFRKI